MKMKNIVFDIGNVLVRWAPLEVIASVFPELEPKDFFKKMYPIWIELNLGKLTEEEAVDRCHLKFGLPKKRLAELLLEFTLHQKPLDGSIELLGKLQKLGFNLFSITDNVREILAHHRRFSQFPKYFKDIISSSEVGILKPDSRIYKHLLDKHRLKPEESVFIDDLLINVEGAIAVGMQAFQFIDYDSCKKQLSKLIGKNL
jgi:putative hydrolase of the HAD superfamily